MKEYEALDPGNAGEEPFLSRWSRRKHAAHTSAMEAEVQQAPAEESPSPSLTDADMPPLESLDENSDYSGFLSPEVTEELRQMALQKLFRSACFNVCDGLDDYAEDYTTFEKLGDVMTADLRFRLQQEASRAAEQAMAGKTEETTASPQARLAEKADGAEMDADAQAGTEDERTPADGDDTEAAS